MTSRTRRWRVVRPVASAGPSGISRTAALPPARVAAPLAAVLAGPAAVLPGPAAVLAGPAALPVLGWPGVGSRVCLATGGSSRSLPGTLAARTAEFKHLFERVGFLSGS